LHSRTHFRRDRGRRVPFSCFALPDSFSAVPRASGPVFMFCALGLVFGGIETLFHVLLSRIHFRRYRGRRVLFSWFARPTSFSAVPRASGTVFMFCALGIVFRRTEGIGSHFHVLCAETYFRRYRRHRVPFSCFASPSSFSAVPRASGLVFMFCASGLIFGGTEGVESCFHVLRSRTHFRWYRVRRVSFLSFALPDSFSAVARASDPVFMFFTPGHVFGVTEGVTSFFHVLYSRTRLRRYRGRWVHFSCFAPPDSFSAVTRASAPVFMFCTPELIFCGTEGVGSHFNVFRSQTHFRRYRRR
jgi:hypothetical protein